LRRFVDTRSAINILGFKHSFTNLPGLEDPQFSVKIFTSDKDTTSETEWKQVAYTDSKNNILFLRSSERYAKFELDFEVSSDISSANFLLLVQIEINEPSIPNISEHSRNVLSRFPTWTKMYTDSLEREVSETATPISQAGKIVSSIFRDDLDEIDRLVDSIELESYISSADIRELAWIYISTPVDPGFVEVRGDGIQLGRLSSYEDLIKSLPTDYSFYYDFLSRSLYTLRPFDEIKTDQKIVDQIVVQNYNSFDEFGLRVGLNRLYLESNDNFKKRILDVYLNPPSVSKLGLQKTLRRELDIWRAYGATPDSNYVGATPEIIEILNLQKSTPYFDLSGNPLPTMFSFVEELNDRFAVNVGYAKWRESYWDYAGAKQEGVSSIPQISDVNNINQEYYQTGVGDFDDAKVILETLDRQTADKYFTFNVKGIKSDEIEYANEPISIYYDSYVSYYEKYYDHGTATLNYIIDLRLRPHGTMTSARTYSALLVDKPKNIYAPNSSSSPEYIIRNIFTPTNYSDPTIRFTDNSTPYYNIINPSATQSYAINQIPAAYVESATITYSAFVDNNNSTGNYGWIRLEGSTPNNYITSSNTRVIKNTATPTYQDLTLKLASNIYNDPKSRLVITTKVRSSAVNQKLNESPIFAEKNNIVINPSDIKSKFVLPVASTPEYIYIENVVVDKYDVNHSTAPYSNYGGVSHNRQTDNYELIPSSPNIIISILNPDFATPHLHDSYIDVTGGSTYNYYFKSIKWPYQANPEKIMISSADGAHYPLEYKVWENFESSYNSTINYKISNNGALLSTPNDGIEDLNNQQNNLIGTFDFTRSQLGLSAYEQDPNLIIKSIEVINNDNETIVWQENSYDELGNINLNYLDNQDNKYKMKSIQFNAKYDIEAERYLIPSLRSGWYYYQSSPNYGATQGYIYAEPKLYTSSSDYSFSIGETAKAGSPIVVNVISNGSTAEYYQVSFYEEATPSNLSYYNFEYIIATNPYSIFLAYKDVFDVSIYDTYTGEYVTTNESSSTNEIKLFSIPEQTPFVIDREYKVTYRVRNVFNVDNFVYNNLTEQYETNITLLSTPNSNYTTSVTYESSLYDKDFEINNVYLNPVYNPISEGYLYLSHDSYDAQSADLYVSPKEILDDQIDFSVISILSKDQNGNPKPNQTFEISGQNISATPQYVTTNSDGLGKAIIRNSGSSISKTELRSIYINGVQNGSINADDNSDSYGISATANYYVKPANVAHTSLYADPDKKIITADGKEVLNIIGETTSNSTVYWRKARSVYSALAMGYSASSATPGQSVSSGYVVSDQYGKFKIGPFIVQNDATPGYWFTVVDTESNSSISTNPITISGDIVYWYEKYDSVQSDNQESVYIPTSNESSEYESYREDLKFKVDSITGSEYYDSEAATPWNMPRWYPIDRFTQYQLGYFGSTPNTINNLDNLHKDFEEE